MSKGNLSITPQERYLEDYVEGAEGRASMMERDMSGNLLLY
jgi:hypothetical protein